VGCRHLNHCWPRHQFALYSITINTRAGSLGQL
jgi:hypothetical protein